MARFGFIHEKLDIKLLILYILDRLPGPVDNETLAELVMCDDGFSYFDYAECLSELVDNGNIDEGEEGYAISADGSRNVRTVESSLPLTVRSIASRGAAAVAAAMKRESMIKASHFLTAQGAPVVVLSLSDGKGEIAEMRLLVSDEGTAAVMENNFRRDAEKLYLDIVNILAREN